MRNPWAAVFFIRPCGNAPAKLGERTDVFAHCSELVGLEFSRQLLHLDVDFELQTNDARGPRAVRVRPVGTP